MKNARTYEPKIKKLLAPARKARTSVGEPAPAVETIVRGLLQADTTDDLADKAYQKLLEEYVDLNELRVAQVKETAEALGEDFPRARDKAKRIRATLQGIFQRRNALDTSYLDEMPKRELRRHLLELGMDIYGAAYAVLMSFEGHAVCVDDTLAGCLEMDGYLEPETSVEDAQGFLERVVHQKEAHAVHALLREYAAKRGKALAKKRHAEAEAARKAAEAAAEAARKAAEAEAKAKAEKKAAKAKAAKAAKAKAARSKAAKAKAARKSAKKTAPKTAKKATKKPAAKPAKKSAKKSAKKTPAQARSSRKPAAKKAAQRPARKATRKATKKTSAKKAAPAKAKPKAAKAAKAAKRSRKSRKS